MFSIRSNKCATSEISVSDCANEHWLLLVQHHNVPIHFCWGRIQWFLELAIEFYECDFAEHGGRFKCTNSLHYQANFNHFNFISPKFSAWNTERHSRSICSLLCGKQIRIFWIWRISKHWWWQTKPKYHRKMWTMLIKIIFYHIDKYYRK